MRWSRHRGGVLILTMVVLASVTAILATAVATENAEVRAGILRLERSKARIAAESGIQYALSAFIEQDANMVSQVDAWYALGTQSSDLFQVGNVTFRLQIADASSLVNLNTAPEVDLQNMGLTSEQIDSLLDWREEGTTPRTEGAKDEFYNSLAFPYNAQLRRMDTLDELLLIKGFDPATLIQDPTLENTSGTTPTPLYSLSTVDSFAPNTVDGQQMGDINTVQVNALVQQGVPQPVAAAIIARRNQLGGQFTTLAQALQVNGMTLDAAGAVVDNYVVGAAPRGEGRINVNTANEAVLMTITGMTTDVAQGIISRQSAGITALSELLQVPGFTLELLQTSADRFTTRSETFLIRVEGQCGSTRVPLEAVVSINGGRTRILKVYDPPQADMRELWGWPEDTTNDVVLAEAQ